MPPPASCTAHVECPSDACMVSADGSGTCLDATDVAYSDPRGHDNPACTLDAPCPTVAEALATGRPYIRIRGTHDEQLDISRTVTLLGESGAVIGGLVVTGDGVEVSAYDLEIAPPDGGIGATIPQTSGSPTLTLLRTTIHGGAFAGIYVAGGHLVLAQSIMQDNPGGGVWVLSPATFEIVGNVFEHNGSPDSPVGGVLAQTTANPGNRLAFNTFYGNGSQDGAGSALRCFGMTARDNLYLQNGPEPQIVGNCGHEHSIGWPAGTWPSGVAAVDPRLGDDLRPLPGSPAIAADPDADTSGMAARDPSGATRALPATIGAYQEGRP